MIAPGLGFLKRWDNYMCLLPKPQISGGFFLSVPTPIFATKVNKYYFSFFSIFRGLPDLHPFAPLTPQKSNEHQGNTSSKQLKQKSGKIIIRETSPTFCKIHRDFADICPQTYRILNRFSQDEYLLIDNPE